MSRNIQYAKIDELGFQVPISWNGSRWVIVPDNIPNTPVNGVYRAGNRDYFLVLDPDEIGRLNGDPNQLASTLWRLDHQSGQLIAARDFSGEGVTGLVQKVSWRLPAKPKNTAQLLSDPPQVGGSPRLPRNLDLQISHEDFVAGLNDISDQGGNTFINLKSADGSITLKLHVSRNAKGDLSLSQIASFKMEGESIDAQVTPLPARDGGYRITAQGKTFYFYGGEDVKRYWVNQGYSDLLGPNPHSGEELRIAHAVTHTSGDSAPIRQLLQGEINKRPLPNNLRLAGLLPVKDVRSGKPFILRDQGYRLELPSGLKNGRKRGEIVVTFFDVENGDDHTTVLHGPQGFTREVKFSTDLATLKSSINLNGVPVYLDVRLKGKNVHVRLDSNGTQNVVFVPGLEVISDIKKVQTNTGVLGALNRFSSDESGSTPLDYDAHITQARAHGFTPSSPKAFCTFANLGVATLAGMGVEWFFSGDEENGEHHTRAVVGFWRHVATALATGYTSTLFSNGRISMDQALKSYGKGLLTGLPIDFGFNAAGFGSSPFGFAASFLANYFGDNVVDALIARIPLASKLAATAGLALFLGSTAYSYYTETHQNNAVRTAMA